MAGDFDVPDGCVAGVYTPAFVERRIGDRGKRSVDRVSPEFILRPSLSDVAQATTAVRTGRLRVSPEFILRPSLSAKLCRPPPLRPGCRRSLYSGLR